MKLPLPFVTFFGASLSLAFASLASAQLSDPNLWKANTGPEMPGASASLEIGSDRGKETVGLDYDFSNGGGYVAIVYSSPLPDPFKELRFQVYLDTPHNIAVRLADSEGEVFQYAIGNVSSGEWSDQRVKLSDAPTSTFMTSEQTAGNGKLDFPITSVWLIMENNQREDAQGKVKFREIEVK